MKADKIILELFDNRQGVYIYVTNLFHYKKLIGCVAAPSVVDPLLDYVIKVVKEAQ